MKKNLLTVLILVLCLVNLVFSALIVFTILPQSKQLNKMITDVCQAVNLNLRSGSAVGADSVAPEDQITYQIGSATDATKDITVSVKDGYALFKVTMILNSKSENATKYTTDFLKQQDGILLATVRETLAKRTVAEIKDAKIAEDITDEILTEFQTLYGKDYVIKVVFNSLTAQEAN